MINAHWNVWIYDIYSYITKTVGFHCGGNEKTTEMFRKQYWTLKTFFRYENKRNMVDKEEQEVLVWSLWRLREKYRHTLPNNMKNTDTMKAYHEWNMFLLGTCFISSECGYVTSDHNAKSNFTFHQCIGRWLFILQRWE